MNVVETIQDIVKIEDIVSRLCLRLRPFNGSLLGDCPTGHPSEYHRCFCVNGHGNYFHCFQCGEAGDAIRLVELVKGLDPAGATQWILEEFLPALVPIYDHLKMGARPWLREYYQRGSLYELTYQYGHKLLFEPEGESALRFLTNGNQYTVEMLRETEWVFFPDDEAIRSHLLSLQPYAEEQIDVLPLQGPLGDRLRLAFPYRDRRGVITGFVKMVMIPEGMTVETASGEVHTVRYDHTDGIVTSDLFNLCNCPEAEELIVLQAYGSAMYLPTVGIRNVVATGGGPLAESHINGLRAGKVKRLILCFDNDRPQEEAMAGGWRVAGVDLTKQALDLLKETGLRAFVIDPLSMTVCRDPEDFVKAQGVEDFKKLCSTAESAAKWRMLQIFVDHDLNVDTGYRQAVDEAIAYSQSIKDPLDKKSARAVMKKILGLSEEELDSMTVNHRERQILDQLEHQYAELLREGQELLRQGQGVTAIRSLLEQRVNALSVECERARIAPGKPLKDYLKEKLNREQHDVGGLLGYGMSRYKGLEQNLSGIQQGLYVIGSATNTGKTALLTNLFLDLLETNESVRGLFFSFGDHKDAIINRFVSIQSDLEINAVRRKPRSELEQRKVRQAYERLMKLSDRGRLALRDRSDLRGINTLEAELRERSEQPQIVVIDELLSAGHPVDPGLLHEELFHLLDRLRTIVEIFGVPILTTVDVVAVAGANGIGKTGSNGRHASSLAGQCADVLWFLYNEQPHRDFKSAPEPLLVLDFEKNKLSDYRGTQTLKFFRSKGIMQEYSADLNQGILLRDEELRHKAK